ncbi:ganglioside GM2 activator-like [Corticium candelabrum]|uniref:ganglioside GM2 activator-like n=1 Tax=Corticium candelabrum TaxID=121492 RepID=UPI002E256F7A|nr:ganglioside GM2 activator-like [Corticium candelabrum]
MRVLLVFLLCCRLMLSSDSKIATLEETLRYMSKLFSLGQPLSREQGQLFRWTNCSAISTAALKVNNGSVTPDPVPLPGNITASVGVTLTETLKSPLKAEVTLKKKLPVLGYTSIPCIDNVGSCTYDDLCALIPDSTGECGPPFSTYKLPCHCPFPAGSYYLPPIEIQLPSAGSIPSFLTNGDYYGQASLFDAAGHPVGCYEAYLSLKEE